MSMPTSEPLTSSNPHDEPILPPLDPDITINPSAITVALQYLTSDADAKTAAEWRRAEAALRRGYLVRPDGALEVTGSDGSTVYVVESGFCTVKGASTRKPRTGKLSPQICRGWLASQKRSGACYHCLAAELLRTAQAIELGIL